MLSRIDRVLSRNGKGGNTSSSGASDAPANSGDAAGVIGERFETIQDSLDQLTDMASRFGTFESLLGQLREPLEAEFKSRRDSHVELINLRAANTEISGRLEALNTESRKLAAALAEAEAISESVSNLGLAGVSLWSVHRDTNRRLPPASLENDVSGSFSTTLENDVCVPEQTGLRDGSFVEMAAKVLKKTQK